MIVLELWPKFLIFFAPFSQARVKRRQFIVCGNVKITQRKINTESSNLVWTKSIMSSGNGTTNAGDGKEIKV